MKTEVIDCVQGSEEWIFARIGLVTASRFGDVLAKGQGKTREKYMEQLISEIGSGLPDEGYSNAYMEDGKEMEPLAREAYEAAYGLVRQVGFICTEFVGCSPDGLVGDKGLVEIKCPKRSTHVHNIRKNKMPTTYIPQVQGQMWIAEREWCDFVSYSPSFQLRPLFVVRVVRDDEYISTLEQAVGVFIEILQAEVNAIAPF